MLSLYQVIPLFVIPLVDLMEVPLSKLLDFSFILLKLLQPHLSHFLPCLFEFLQLGQVLMGSL